MGRMEATRIIAVRHGETAWNVDARIQGQLDIQLNDTGRWQARRVGQAEAFTRTCAGFCCPSPQSYGTMSTA